MARFLVYAVVFGFADPEAHFAVRRAAEDAARRLATPACQQVIVDFGLRPPPDVVASFQQLRLFDDHAAAACGTHRNTLAFTEPGSRLVHVCGQRFKDRLLRHPLLAVAVVIHEFLHALGLGENPPSSEAITQRVLARCGGSDATP